MCVTVMIILLYKLLVLILGTEGVKFYFTKLNFTFCWFYINSGSFHLELKMNFLSILQVEACFMVLILHFTTLKFKIL